MAITAPINQKPTDNSLSPMKMYDGKLSIAIPIPTKIMALMVSIQLIT
jgi:hypothetical protein